MVASTAVLGTSTIVGVLLATLRMKLAAVILGAAGIGLIGLIQNFMMTGSAFLGLGIGQAAPREIAKASASSPADERVARKALVVTTLLTAILGAGLVAVFAKPIAVHLYGDASLTWALAWMSIGTGLTIIASSQTALLAGLGRIRDVARVAIASAVLSTVGALLSLYAWGERAIIPFVLAAPVAACLVGAFYTSRLSTPAGGVARLRLGPETVSLATLGLSLTMTTAVANAAQLGVRALISRDFGLVELGLFQAAWAISTIYLSMILQAMSVDYFPRLAAAGSDPAAANRLINEQTFVGLTIGGPAILLGLGLAPWALHLLYSGDFRPAAALLRWQMLADVLRLSSWPLGYMLLAAGPRRTFVLVETVAQATFVAVSAVLLPYLGIEAAGVALLCAYAVHLPLSFMAVSRLSGFRWSPEVMRRFWILLSLAVAIFAVVFVNEVAAAFIAIPSSAVLFALWASRMIKLVIAPDVADGDTSRDA